MGRGATEASERGAGREGSGDGFQAPGKAGTLSREQGGVLHSSPHSGPSAALRDSVCGREGKGADPPEARAEACHHGAPFSERSTVSFSTWLALSVPQILGLCSTAILCPWQGETDKATGTGKDREGWRGPLQGDFQHEDSLGDGALRKDSPRAEDSWT